jgi:hypothetical protein
VIRNSPNSRASSAPIDLVQPSTDDALIDPSSALAPPGVPRYSRHAAAARAPTNGSPAIHGGCAIPVFWTRAIQSLAAWLSWTRLTPAIDSGTSTISAVAVAKPTLSSPSCPGQRARARRNSGHSAIASTAAHASGTRKA